MFCPCLHVNRVSVFADFGHLGLKKATLRAVVSPTPNERETTASNRSFL